MTRNRQDGLTVHIGVAKSERLMTGPLPSTRCPRAGTWQDRPLSRAPEWVGLAGFVLACLVLPAFCLGLFALAMLPSLEVAVPRWLILTYGAGCVLLAQLAVLLSSPWQQRQPALELSPRRHRS
jgi:hypothetical protein